MNPEPTRPDETNVPQDEPVPAETNYEFPGSTPVVPEEAPADGEAGREQLDLDLNVDSDQAPGDNLAALDEENQYGNL